jgi:2-polyprenyl-3-methyl-5-hydroxy-6-metoxy-1,4-benzoquinol methylase
MRLAKGLREKGIVVGNTFDKYESSNPVVQKIMNGFSNTLSELVHQASPSTIHDVGCGEGYWVREWVRQGKSVRGTDFSSKIIDLAKLNALERNISPALFEIKSIYDLQTQQDAADLVVCCEVLEHLDRPEEALDRLRSIVKKYLIISVPREPIWRFLNLARGKYIASLGNTPGHIQHWSKSDFVRLISSYFKVVCIKTPLPWTMLLCRPQP